MWKPGDNPDAIQMSSAFTTNAKSPNVRTVSGSVMRNRSQPTVAFTRPITTAASSAAPKLRTWNPGTMCATTSRPMAFRSQWRRKRMRA